MNHFSKLSLLVSGCAVMVGCATSSKDAKAPPTDEAAAKRSQVYLDNLELIAVTGKFASNKPCAVPASAEKFNASQGASKDWTTLVAHANTCVKEKNWKTLEALANHIARIDIDSPWGAYFLSVAAEGVGEMHRALWMVDLAQKKAGGKSPLFAYQKGRIFYGLKETSRAMKEIEQAVASEPRLVEGHMFLASVYHRDMENDKASNHYASVLKVDAKDVRALVALGELKLQAGKGEEAADFYARAVALQPEKLSSWVKLASIYETVLKKNPEALAAYKNMKGALDSGHLRERPQFDVSAKIKSLEEAVRPRVPAQASTVQPDAAKTVK